jgi:hypothetical protein
MLEQLNTKFGSANLMSLSNEDHGRHLRITWSLSLSDSLVSFVNFCHGIESTDATRSGATNRVIGNVVSCAVSRNVGILRAAVDGGGDDCARFRVITVVSDSALVISSEDNTVWVPAS